MADIVVMPKLGLLMETGEISTWIAGEGDQVSIGDVIAEITTEKITYELEAQAEGTLLQILLGEDEEAPVGEPIAVIGQPGEDISALGIAATGEAEAPPTEEQAVETAAPTAVALSLIHI